MNIIVTGASRGIGYETVKLFAQQNGHTIIAIARNNANLLKLKKECAAFKTNSIVHVIAFDLNEVNLKAKLLPQIRKSIGKVDILINNAATIINKPFLKITHKELYDVYNTNVFSVFLLTQALLPLIKANAHIVNIASMGGFQGSVKFPGLSAYSSSKAAVVGLTECLAEELKKSKIKVNCLCFGAVQTKMLQEAFPNFKAPISAHEMAKYVVEFALNAHKLINGKVIPVALSTP